MSDNNVGLEAREKDKTNIHSPPTSGFGGEDTDKMAAIAAMDGIEVSDAILQAMEEEVLFEREKLARKGREPVMTPHHVDPAPRLPPVPPYGVSQDVRYQYNYPENARGDAQRGTFQQKLQDYQVTPPFHQQMVTGSPEHAQSEFRDLEQKVRTNSIMIESLKDALQEIKHNIANMEEAFTGSLAASNRNIRSLGKRMMSLEVCK